MEGKWILDLKASFFKLDFFQNCVLFAFDTVKGHRNECGRKRKKMGRICIYCETWASGGIESFLYNMLSHMDISGLEIDIVATCIKDSLFIEELKNKGIHFYELSGKKYAILQNAKCFLRLARLRSYDVVHINAFQALSLYFLHMARRMGVPVRIAHSHNTMLRKSKTYLIKIAIHNISKEMFSCDATDLWACSSAAANFLFPKDYLKKDGFTLIPNGIDTNRFRFNADVRQKVRQRFDLEGKFVIGNVGRLCYQKNQNFLLDVLVAVLKYRPDSRLLLVGDGESKEQLKERAIRLGISNAVIFCGAIRQVERLYWAMDVFAFPSHFEGLGIVAIESQAAGLITVCSCGIPQEACVTPLFKRLPIKAGAGAWADMLLSSVGMQISRDDLSKEIKNAQYDITDVSFLIKEQYTRKTMK